MTARIVEGSTVLVLAVEPNEEAQACGPVEDGSVNVRFTTRGPEFQFAARDVSWVADPW